LWINVDHGAEPNPPHCRRGGREQCSRARGQRAWPLGLAHELGAVPATQPEERRGAEQLELRQAGLQLFERSRGVGELRTRDEDAHEVAKRRVAERASALELAHEEAGHIVTDGVLYSARLRLEGLNEDTAGRVAAAAPGELGEELERPLLGAKIWQSEPGVCVDDSGKLDAGEVVALRDHLRPDEDGTFGTGEALECRTQLRGLRDRVGVEPDPLELGYVLLELALEPLRPRPDPGELGRAASWARLPRRLA
jgi:hypothetical protein